MPQPMRQAGADRSCIQVSVAADHEQIDVAAPVIITAGKPRESDLLSAYRSRKFEMSDHGHEGGRMYIGRSGNRQVQIGVDVDERDGSGDGEVIYHGQWKGGQ